MRRLALFTTFSVFALASPRARADADVSTASAPRPLSESLTGPAKTDYDVGKVLFRDGDFEGARVKFEGAYEKSKDPRLLFNIAACERNRNNYGRTIRLIRQYRKDADAVLSDADKKEADDVLVGLRSLVAPLTLQVNEVGATVYIDDDLVGISPLPEPVLVEFRKHKIRIVKEGFAQRDIDIEVKDPSGITKTLVLEKPEGRVVVVARPGDTIDLDGRLVSIGRLEAVVPYGGHQLKVTSPGYITYQSEVVLQDRQPRTINVSLQKEKGSGLPLWAWLGGGALIATGAAVGGYIIFRNGTSADQQGITTQQGTAGGVKVMAY